MFNSLMYELFAHFFDLSYFFTVVFMRLLTSPTSFLHKLFFSSLTQLLNVFSTLYIVKSIFHCYTCFLPISSIFTLTFSPSFAHNLISVFFFLKGFSH